MNHSNHTQLAAQLYNPDGFRNAMADAGIPIEETPPADGEFYRSGREKEIWCIRFPDGGGAAGNWKTGVKATWAPGKRSSDDELVKLQKACQAQKRKREAGYLAAKKRAQQLWRDAYPATDHAYLATKGVNSHGLRILGNQLLIPLTISQQIQTLQLINPDGSKRFLKGGRAAGGYYPIGQPRARIWLAEGYATAASVHEVTGGTVVVAFNCGNLTPVLGHLQQRFPESQFLIAADNDEPGLREADQALKMGAAASIAPPPEQGIVDWNDHAQKYGLKETRAALAEVFE